MGCDASVEQTSKIIHPIKYPPNTNKDFNKSLKNSNIMIPIKKRLSK